MNLAVLVVTTVAVSFAAIGGVRGDWRYLAVSAACIPLILLVPAKA